MWRKTIAVFLVLGLLAVFGLGYLSMPEAGDSIQQSQFELTRLCVFIALLLAWAATMASCRIKFRPPAWQTGVGATFVVASLVTAFVLNYWLMPTPADVQDREQYDVIKQYEMLAEYPLLAASAFLLLVSGVTLACWGTETRRAINADTLSMEIAQADDEHVVTRVDEPAETLPIAGRTSHKRARQRV